MFYLSFRFGAHWILLRRRMEKARSTEYICVRCFRLWRDALFRLVERCRLICLWCDWTLLLFISFLVDGKASNAMTSTCYTQVLSHFFEHQVFVSLFGLRKSVRRRAITQFQISPTFELTTLGLRMFLFSLSQTWNTLT